MIQREETYACRQCGKEYTMQSKRQSTKYCSAVCCERYNNAKKQAKRRATRPDDITKACPCCGEMFTCVSRGGKTRIFCTAHCRRMAYGHSVATQKREEQAARLGLNRLTPLQEERARRRVTRLSEHNQDRMLLVLGRECGYPPIKYKSNRTGAGLEAWKEFLTGADAQTKLQLEQIVKSLLHQKKEAPKG